MVQNPKSKVTDSTLENRIHFSQIGSLEGANNGINYGAQVLKIVGKRLRRNQGLNSPKTVHPDMDLVAIKHGPWSAMPCQVALGHVMVKAGFSICSPAPSNTPPSLCQLLGIFTPLLEGHLAIIYTLN